METNLNSIKRVAIRFLHTSVEKNKKVPGFLLHPFFESRLTLIEQNGEETFIDILASEENYMLAVNFYEKIINECDSVINILMMMRNPEKRTFFKYINSYLSEEDYANLWREIWQSTEFPHFDINVGVPEMLDFFKKSNKNYLMSNEEHEKYKELPDEVTVYRGYFEDSYYDAISWTLNPLTAEKFATRFSDYGNIYKAVIEKKYIIALFEYEDEVIVDYKYLKDIESIKQVE